MKAVSVIEPGKLGVVEVAEPTASNEALVRVRRVGICGTDVKILSGAIPVEYPRIMGHEMIGEVVQSGSQGVVSVGQRVMADPAIACGYCRLCWGGKPHLCINGGLLGRDLDGVFAQYIRVPESRLLPIPETIGDTASGVLQILGTCVHALRTASVFPGDVVAVVGLGVAGQLFVQLLRAQGAIVVGITRSEWKRQLAAKHGAAATVAPPNAVALLDEFTHGRGADLVVESAGYESTIAQSIELARVGGEILVFGTVASGNQGLPYYQLYLKELTIYNSRAALPTDYQRGIELAASGQLDLESIVTHQLDLADAVEAFALVGGSSSLKVLMSVE